MQIIVILCFLSYLFLVLQYKLLAGEGAKDLTAVLLRNGHLQFLNRRALTTAPLMLLCIIGYSTQDQYHFLQAALSEKASLQTTLLVSICLLVSVYSTDQFKRRIRTNISIREIIIYFLIRVPGLVIYETFFRGVILGICLEWFSVPATIMLNIILYAVAHAFGSRKEFLGSIPFGFFLCYITVANESVYPAVIAHLVLALPYEAILFTKCQLLTKKFES
jgi:membrane protease YdiL (CAAX protease family)